MQPGETLHATIDGLARGFAARKPVRAGSLIVTVFGDAVMPRGGLVATQSLLDVMGLFHIGQGLVRTSLSRLCQEGMFARTRAGRRSYYRLTETAWDQYEQASEVIYTAPGADAWAGGWLVVLPVAGAAGGGNGLDPGVKRGLLDLGFARLGTGVYIRPSNLLPAMGRKLDRLVDDQPVLVIDGPGSALPSGFKSMVETTWSVDDLGRRYAQFVRRYEPIATSLDRGVGIGDAQALILRLLVVHEFRLLVLKDPLLPAAVLPVGWSGGRAREITRGIYGHVFAPSERWIDAHCEGENGPLPPPGAVLLNRFGGMA